MDNRDLLVFQLESVLGLGGDCRKIADYIIERESSLCMLIREKDKIAKHLLDATPHPSDCNEIHKACKEILALTPTSSSQKAGITEAIEKLEAVKEIPFYAYGDNQAAVQMMGAIEEALRLLRHPAEKGQP